MGLYGGDLQEAKELLEGSTVLSVLSNNDDEGVFTLVVEKNGKRQRVRLYATDLGWWLKTEQAGNKKR